MQRAEYRNVGFLLLLIVAFPGCASLAAVAPARDEQERQRMSTALGAPARAASGSRTQTVGLPLTRGQKIGLWAGVAVFLGYLMATDGEDDSAGAAEP